MATKTKVVLDEIEKGLEAVEPVLEKIETELVEDVTTVKRIPRLRLNGTTRKQQIVILAFTAGVSAAVAGAAAWKLSQRRMAKEYQERLEREVAQTRAFYQGLEKPDDIKELAADLGLESAVQAVERYQGREVEENAFEKVEVPDTVTHNIFVEGQPMNADEFDYDTEVPLRSEDTPYVITQQEFLQGEKDYVQNTIRWYDGDDVLVDDKNQPIDSPELYIGDAMHHFGKGSGDPRIVYVRSDVHEVDFEVVKDDNSYASAIGFRHADRPVSRKVRRSRVDDDG